MPPPETLPALVVTCYRSVVLPEEIRLDAGLFWDAKPGEIDPGAHAAGSVVRQVGRSELLFGLGAFAALVAGAVVFAYLSMANVAATLRSDLEKLLDTVPVGHFAYLGARIATGMQLASLAQVQPLVSPDVMARLASASVTHLPGIAAFVFRDARGEILWMVPEARAFEELATPLATLREAAQEDPGRLATTVAEFSGWGRTLLVRFPASAAETDGAELVAALMLEPMYDTLFNKEFRAGFGFEVYEDSTPLFAHSEHEPRPDPRFRASRSFPVAGHQWTMTVWPHRSLALGRLRRAWWTVFGTGFAGALLVTTLLTLVMARWAAMNRRIQLAETRFREIVEHAEDMIVSLTPGGRVTESNPAATRILGYGPEELRSLSAEALVCSESAPDWARFLARETGSHPAPVTLNLRRKDGICRTAEATAYRQGTEDGRLRIDAILRDVTERKELEQMKADFLAMLTHDIKNPLGVILGYVQVLDEDLAGRIDPEERDFLRRIGVSANRVLELVKNFLWLSRAEAGMSRLSLSPTSVNTLLRQATEQQQGAASTRNIHIDLDLDAQLPEIAADAFQLDRVFSNLLSNALKHSPVGGTVTVCSRGNRQEVVVSVTDRGAGIPAEQIPLLFQRYARSQESDRTDSTGLGLYIVKSIVTAHGGRVEVLPGQGEGATFTVHLPVSGSPLQ